jgi:hypothetical protein
MESMQAKCIPGLPLPTNQSTLRHVFGLHSGECGRSAWSPCKQSVFMACNLRQSGCHVTVAERVQVVDAGLSVWLRGGRSRRSTHRLVRQALAVGIPGLVWSLWRRACCSCCPFPPDSGSVWRVGIPARRPADGRRERPQPGGAGAGIEDPVHWSGACSSRLPFACGLLPGSAGIPSQPAEPVAGGSSCDRGGLRPRHPQDSCRPSRLASLGGGPGGAPDGWPGRAGTFSRLRTAPPTRAAPAAPAAVTLSLPETTSQNTPKP